MGKQDPDFLAPPPVPSTSHASCKGKCGGSSDDVVVEANVVHSPPQINANVEPDPVLYPGLVNELDIEDDKDSGNGSVLEFTPNECQVNRP
jgi:hypothetical protein